MSKNSTTENGDVYYYTKGNLKAASGWTDRLIKELLGEPDYIKEHYVYELSGGHWSERVWKRTRFYLVSRVEEAQKSELFKKNKRVRPQASESTAPI